MSARVAGLAMLAALAACQPSNGADALSANLGASEAGLEQKPLTITKADGTSHRFTVEVARTPEQQQTGLMNRQTLAPDRGMIFPYDPPQPASFWMKNTLIPLDMIFIRADGSIARIEANTVPLSLDPVAAGETVAAVLELAGGRSAELGIKPGDRVKW